MLNFKINFYFFLVILSLFPFNILFLSNDINSQYLSQISLFDVCSFFLLFYVILEQKINLTSKLFRNQLYIFSIFIIFIVFSYSINFIFYKNYLISINQPFTIFQIILFLKFIHYFLLFFYLRNFFLENKLDILNINYFTNIISILFLFYFIFINFYDLRSSDQRLDFPFTGKENSNLFSYTLVYLFFVIYNLHSFYSKNILYNGSFLLFVFVWSVLFFNALSRSSIVALLILLIIFIASYIYNSNFKFNLFKILKNIFIILILLITLFFSFIIFQENYNLNRAITNFMPLIERGQILLFNLEKFEYGIFHYFFGRGFANEKILDNLFLSIFWNLGLIGLILYVLLFFLFIYKIPRSYYLFIFFIITSFFSEYLIHSVKFLNVFFILLPLLYIKNK